MNFIDCFFLGCVSLKLLEVDVDDGEHQDIVYLLVMTFLQIVSFVFVGNEAQKNL